MSAPSSTDDYALESVPSEARKGWLHLTWGTTGIITTLIGLFVGAVTTFVAGLKLAMIASLTVTLIGGSFGWMMGHVAYRTGLSSTMIARSHGFSTRGAAVPALVFGFMMIGFLAMENLLLYRGLLFFLGWPDTTGAKILIYGAMSITWMLLTTYGFKLVSRTASISQILFLAALAFIVIKIVSVSDVPLGTMIGFPSQYGVSALAAMGISSDTDKILFCINLSIGQAGALALVDADLGRYARRSRDIGIAAFLGLGANTAMVALGGLILYAGMPMLIAYFQATDHLTPAAARDLALQSPDQIVTAFIIFGGVIGSLLMVFAQLKAQVLNTYSASLSLTNLFDTVFGVRPGRLLFVIFANVCALALLAGDALGLFQRFLAFLGVMTTGMATLMVTDFVLSGRLGRQAPTAGGVNWLGIASLGFGVSAGLFAPSPFNIVPFATAVILTALSYTIGYLLIAPAIAGHGTGALAGADAG